MSNTCFNCRYHSPAPTGEQVGLCHRNPPTVLVVRNEITSAVPLVVNNHYCGEHFPIQKHEANLKAKFIEDRQAEQQKMLENVEKTETEQ